MSGCYSSAQEAGRDVLKFGAHLAGDTEDMRMPGVGIHAGAEQVFASEICNTGRMGGLQVPAVNGILPSPRPLVKQRQGEEVSVVPPGNWVQCKDTRALVSRRRHHTQL